jgi:hypothetical protein
MTEEPSCEQGISVVDEEPILWREATEVVDQVPRHLLHPPPVGDRRDPRDLDLSRRQIDYEEHDDRTACRVLSYADARVLRAIGKAVAPVPWPRRGTPRLRYAHPTL